MADFNIYRSLTSPYIRLVRHGDGKVYDAAAEEVGAATSWSNSALSLTISSVIGGYPVSLDALAPGLPNGEYDFLLYDNASPADSDEVVLGKRIRWTGKQLLGLPIDL